MGSTLLEGTYRVFSRCKKKGEKVRGGVGVGEKVEVEKDTREGDCDARERDGEASEGVVPGSTNQRQDAIDRHVAPGWCNEFRRGGGREAALLPPRPVTAAEVVAMAKETEMVDRERKGSSHPGGRRKSGRGQEGGGRACSAHSVTLTGKPY